MSPILGIWASQISGRLWEPAGAYDALATTTLSSATTTITFAGIPTGYKHLQLRVFYKLNVNDNLLAIRFNGDTTSNYSFHGLYGLGSGSVAAYGNATQNRIEMFYNWSNVTKGTTDVFTAGVIDILDYASTTKAKTVRGLGGIDYNPGGQIHLDSGLWYKTPEAINTITLNVNDYSSQFQQYSQFALYGVK